MRRGRTPINPTRTTPKAFTGEWAETLDTIPARLRPPGLVFVVSPVLAGIVAPVEEEPGARPHTFGCRGQADIVRGRWARRAAPQGMVL
jgi:hypothetical protein